MARFIGGYRSRETGGWFRKDYNIPDFLQLSTDGWWTTELPTYNISGIAAGKGHISGNVASWFYINATDTDIKGKGLISSDFSLEVVYNILGSGIGKGLVSSETTFGIPIRISGVIFGKGKVFHRLNYSKTNAHNPTLRTQNIGYKSSECPIAAIEYQGFSPNKIINILDESDSVFENTESAYIVEDIQYTGVLDRYPINHYPYSDLASGLIDYVVTDIRSDNQNGQPLFYQYELLYDAKSTSADTLVRNIYKNNETISSRKSYEVQISNDLISQGSTRYDSSTWGAPSGSFGSVVKRARVLLPIDFADEKSFYTIEYDKVVNGIVTYQKELIELIPLYTKDNDYKIYSDGLALPVGSSISNTNSLIILKDPRSRISPLEIVSLKDEGSFTSYISDANSTWNIRFNIGSFLRPSGFYIGNSEQFYYLPNTNTAGRLPITNVKPELRGTDILKVKAFPIFVDSDIYSYPDYRVSTYDKTTEFLIDPSGKIAIDVNGTTRPDIKILSIDREKGYLLLDTDLNPTDEIEVSYYIENDSSLVLENLELNPKIEHVSAISHHISEYPNGLGLAMREYDGTDSSKLPYIYDTSTSEDSRIVKSVPPIGDPTTTGNWADYNFFSVCEVNLNKLTKDIVKLTDARAVGGGVDTVKIQSWFNENFGDSYKIHESEWYTTNGYYDGEPLANNGAIIMHVPEVNLSGLKQQWIDHFVEEGNAYDIALDLGTKEFKYYLDQTIKRYISAGSDYILLPTLSGNPTDIMYLE